jgi:hypothetical protein
VSSIVLVPFFSYYFLALQACWSLFFLVPMISVFLLLLCFRNIEILVSLKNDMHGSVFLFNILLTCQKVFQIVRANLLLH